MRKAGVILGFVIAASCNGAGHRFGVDINGGGEGGSTDAAGGDGDALGGQLPEVSGGAPSVGGNLSAGGISALGGNADVSKSGAAGEGGAATEEPPGCSATTPFGKPTLLFKANATKRMSGRFWPDEKSIFFVVDGDIFNSTRSSTTVAFPDGAAIGGVKTPGLEYAPTITRDGKTLYFNASQEGILKMATRLAIDGDFANPEDVAGLMPYPDAPFLAGNDDVLYYDANDADDLFVHHIWRADLTEFGVANNEIQVAYDDLADPSSPAITRDELTLYYAVRDGKSRRVYVSTRTNRSDDFGLPREVAGVNTLGDSNRPTWVSDDGCRLVIESEQTLYLAVKTK